MSTVTGYDELTNGQTKAVISKMGGPETALAFLRGEYILTKITQAVRNTLTAVSNLTLEQRVALGKYDWKNSDINEERFPHDSTTVGEWEYDLYHPSRDISSEEAKSSAEVDGWIVAKAEHLLSFGESFPEEQRKYPIVALGSVCGVGGRRRVLGLWDAGSKRHLGLCCWRGGWSSHCRFLRVRKVQSSNT